MATKTTSSSKTQAEYSRAKAAVSRLQSQLNSAEARKNPSYKAQIQVQLNKARAEASRAQAAAKYEARARAAKSTTAPAKTSTTKTTAPTKTKTPAAASATQPKPATSPLSFDDFMKSGFYGSANIAALQELLANYNMTDADARQQAEAQYKPEYDLQRVELENQLAQLGVDRDRDIRNLNTQYDRTLNNVMAGLNARRMGRSSLVATRGVETENARNSAISNASYNYLTQQNEVNANLQRANLAYAQNVENRATELKNENDAQRLQLMMNIAQLQQSGYSAYANYLTQRDSLGVDMQRLDNEKLAYQNDLARLRNEQEQTRQYKKKYQNELAQHDVSVAKLDNEKLQYQNQKAQLKNREYEYKLAKKK